MGAHAGQAEAKAKSCHACSFQEKKNLIMLFTINILKSMHVFSHMLLVSNFLLAENFWGSIFVVVCKAIKKDVKHAAVNVN